MSSNAASWPPVRRSQNSSAPSPPATASVPPAPTARLFSSCPDGAANLRHVVPYRVQEARVASTLREPQTKAVCMLPQQLLKSIQHAPSQRCDYSVAMSSTAEGSCRTARTGGRPGSPSRAGCRPGNTRTAAAAAAPAGRTHPAHQSSGLCSLEEPECRNITLRDVRPSARSLPCPRYMVQACCGQSGIKLIGETQTSQAR